MTTRVEMIMASIERWAKRRPWLFRVSVGACVVGTITAIFVALSALLSGPIGLDMQKPFYGSSFSRLGVLQMAASFGLILMVCLLVLMARGRFLLVRAVSSSFFSERPWLFWVSVTLAAVLANIAILADLPVLACIEPDTIGYLRPSALRSSGYMLIIKAIVGLTGDLKWIVPVQLNVMLASFVALGWAARRTLNSQGVGLSVAVVPMLSSGLLSLAPTVMTEAFFVALIAAHIAAVLCVFHRLGWLNLGMVGLTLALMIIVRPNGISFLAGLPLLVYFCKDNWQKVLAATLGPILIVVVAQGLYHQKTFGFFGLHQFGGISLIGAAAPLVKGNMASDYPKLAQELERRFKKYYSDFPVFEDRRFPFEMAHVASLTAVGAIYYQTLPAIRESLGLPDPDIMVFEHDPRLNSIAGSLAVSAIFNNPWGFVKIIASNYIVNWHNTLPLRVPMAVYYPRCLKMDQDIGRQYEPYFSKVTDLDQYRNEELSTKIKGVGVSGIRAIEWPRLIIGVFQKMLGYVTLLLSLWGLLSIFKNGRSDDVHYRALAYGALVLQAGYGLISIGNASFVRYTVVFDPLVILLLSVGFLNALRYLCVDDSTPP